MPVIDYKSFTELMTGAQKICATLQPVREQGEAMIEGLIQKDEAAFRAAIAEFHQSMYALALSIVGASIADEVVQEAWISIMKSISRFERRSSLKTWVLRIVANEAKSRLRREKRMASLDAMLETDPDISGRFDGRGRWGEFKPAKWELGNPEALLSSDELKSYMDLMIRQLPPLQRAALSLREQLDYSLSEICNILDVSESNVRVLVHRARNRLFQCVEHFQLTGEMHCREPIKVI